MRGIFITFEGIDGCGKSTQAGRLAERLRQNGLTVLETREPGGTSIGEQLRAVLLDAKNAEMRPWCELLLYLADRVQHVEETVRPALERNEVVICDRFHDATVAYQHHGRGLTLDQMQDFIHAHVVTSPPALTYWLDLDVVTAQSRIAGRNRGRSPGVSDESRLDDAALVFHERVRAGYGAIHKAEPERVLRMDGTMGEHELHQDVWDRLTERFNVL